MASWSDIQRGIFAGESGGDYNALFNYQNRPNGIFSDVRVTDMSIADVLRFTDPRGEYGQYVASARPDPEMGVATPVGAYQVVGATLRDAVKALNLDPNQKFDKATQDKVGQWIYQTQGTGAWQGYKGPQSKPKDMNMSMNPNAPQRTGLLGFMDIMRKPDEETGLTAMERFGAALDPLLLPEQRMGEQIRARGARRLQTQAKNKTIDTLTKRAESGDQLAAMVLQGLQSGAYDAKTAMSLYMSKKLEAPSTKETFTTATGEQLNERFGTQLDPTKMYNISSTGKITQVGGAGVSIAGPEKEYEKKMGGYYAQKNIDLTNDATNAQSMLQTIDIQESLLNDPSFRSGSGQQLFDAASGFLGRFGIGEADLASNTAFQAFANKSVLDMLGGSLGTGVSNADVSFIRGTVATLDNTGESIAKLLGLQRKVAERKLQVAALARQWKVDNNTNFLDDRWDTYIANWNTENPIFPDADDYL